MNRIERNVQPIEELAFLPALSRSPASQPPSDNGKRPGGEELDPVVPNHFANGVKELLHGNVLCQIKLCSTLYRRLLKLREPPLTKHFTRKGRRNLFASLALRVNIRTVCATSKSAGEANKLDFARSEMKLWIFLRLSPLPRS